MSSDAENRTGAGVVLAKVQGMNKRIVAVVVTLAMVLSLFAGVGIHFATKAATSGYPTIPFDSNGRLEVGANGMERGTYSYTPANDREYTYSFNRDFVHGDVLEYDSQTKRITWTHDPSNLPGRTDIETQMSAAPGEGNTVILSLNNQAALSPNTSYYYEDGEKYYVFSYEDNETLGYISNQQVNGRTFSLPQQNDNVAFIINKNNDTVSFSPDSERFRRRTVYVESPNLVSGEVYLITIEKGNNERLVTYSNSTATHNVDIYLQLTDLSYTYLPLSMKNVSIGLATTNYYDSDKLPINYGEKRIIDSSTSNQPTIATGVPYMPDFLASGNETFTLSGFYQGNYNDSFSMGSLYGSSDVTGQIVLYPVDNTRRRIGYSNYVTPSTGSKWSYNNENKQLTNNGFDANSNRYLYNNGTADSVIRYSSADASVYLYQKEDVFSSSPIDNETAGLSYSIDEYASGFEEPSEISYSESTVSAGGLETNKTVTKSGNNYHVRLESFMEAESLEFPPTDIVLTLDVSNRMQQTMYSRDYQNLNTQTVFEKVSLSDVTHDNLYDMRNSHNVGDWSIAGGERVYTDNKYIEDPNSPGTYVYIAQRYENYYAVQRYQYYFTSSTGAVYKTDWQNKIIIGNLISPIRQLEFTRQGSDHNTDSVASVTLDTIYVREGDNKNNATISNLLNYENNLYYKYSDGTFYPVTITKTPSTNPTSYTLSVTIGEGASERTYTQTYTNMEYGAANSVFQGFKTYKTENGKIIVDNDNSLPGRSLFTMLPNGQTTPVTRLQAEKEAVEDLLLFINQQSLDRGVKQNVAITTFAINSQTPYKLKDVDMADTKAVDEMISYVYGLTASTERQWYFNVVPLRDVSKRARIDLGTAAANTEFSQRSDDGNKRYEIVFTAGIPSNSVPGDFSLDVANDAIANTYTTKNTYGATVYTVGLFDYADSNRLNGDFFYYWLEGLFGESVACDGTVGSTWGYSTAYSWFGNQETNPIDADATNRMLNYMSSNYSSATTSGLATSNVYNPRFKLNDPTTWGSTPGRGFRVRQNFTRTAFEDEQYYYGISSTRWTDTSDPTSGTTIGADELEQTIRQMFTEIETGMEVPLAQLGSHTVMFDGVTDYFDLVSSESQILAYAAPINSTSYDANTCTTVGIKKTVDGKTIAVDGFDFTEHYAAGDKPMKLVVEFDIKRTDDFIGGNQVPTNTANSAIYDEEGHLVERFNMPTVDLPIIMDSQTVKDQSIYYSYEADLTQLFNTEKVTGVNNAYVNIEYTITQADGTPVGVYTIPAGESIGVWTSRDEGTEEDYFPQLEEDTTYKVVCRVDPSLSGRERGKTLPTEGTNEAHVYVFTPQFTATDEYVAKGSSQNPKDNITIDWVHAKVNGEDVDAPIGIEPTLTYQIKQGSTAQDSEAIGNVTINATTDFQIVNPEIAARTFTYEMIQNVAHPVYSEPTQEGEEPTITGYEYYDEFVSGEVQRDAVPLSFTGNTPSVTYVNDEDLNNDNGANQTYTLIVRSFTLKIKKVFDGDYVVPEDVVVTVSGPNGQSWNVPIDADDITDFESQEITLPDTLECGVEYTISEDTSNLNDRYLVTFAGTDAAGNTISDSEILTTGFEFTSETDGDVVTVVVTNRSTTNYVIEGLLHTDRGHAILAIIALVVAALTGMGVFLWKKKDEFIAE